MSEDIRLAFAHPAERALATTGPDPRDRISLRDHVVEAEIGAFQQERGHTQRLRFNVVVEVRPLSDEIDDDVDRILSYDRVTEAIQFELAAERLNLLETLAERVAERILLEPPAMRAFVRIEKLDRGPGALGIEIVRSRKDGLHLVDASADIQPHPRMVFLSNPAIASDYLPGWLDHLQAGDAPAILCVGLPDLARPETGHAMTQRRIDLLAMEQNAWTLAARDNRCVVVATRTELDWAMKHGQISVWAPSKIVLDAVDGPDGHAPTALAAWFAQELGAVDLVVVGDEAPNADIPTRSAPISADAL